MEAGRTSNRCAAGAEDEGGCTNRRKTLDVLGFPLVYDLPTSTKLGHAVYTWRAVHPDGLLVQAHHHDAPRGGWILAVRYLGHGVTTLAATFAAAQSKLGDEILRVRNLPDAVKKGREALAKQRA